MVFTMTNQHALMEYDIVCKDVHKRFHDLNGRDVWGVVLGKEGSYPGFDAVQGASLYVEPGKFLGILGRNGAGKSSLLRTIGGVYPPTSGIVALGHEASGLYELGVSNQMMMTGRQYARRWLELNEVDPYQLDEIVSEIHEFSELEDYFDQPIRTYSSGMKARVFFAVATAPTAKIFLIDEVLSVGDIYFTAKCWGRLRKKLSNGASGILATHDWSAILKLCENSCIMSNGRVEEYGPSIEIVKSYISSPKLADGLARFSLDEDFTVQTDVGESISFEIPLHISTDEQVKFGFSVEQFVLGIGWEHILHHEPAVVSARKGHSKLSILIPDSPLHPGVYNLNLFLLAFDSQKEQWINCDQRAWTCGNEICLTVKGDIDAAGFEIPVKWSVV